MSLLESKNIKLRAPEIEDIQAIYDIENNTGLWQVSQTLVPFSLFDIEQHILRSNKDPFKTAEARFVITKTDTNEIVGLIDLYDVDALNKRAGVGIMIVEKFRNNGYAKEALSVLKKYAFGVLHLHMLHCIIDTDNNKSLKLFTSEGFKISGLLKDYFIKYDISDSNQWRDVHILQFIND